MECDGGGRVDLQNCRTHAMSGKLPDNFEERAAELRAEGIIVANRCAVCMVNYADVVMPVCKHMVCCHTCVAQLQVKADH
jgi:hypothetical protein